MKLGQRVTRVALMSAALFAGAAGVAYATQTLTQTTTATTQIVACQLKAVGTLRVVADGTACSKYETVISWNVAGAKGDPGPQGLTGAAGAPGKDGVDGTNGLDGKDGVDGAAGAEGPTGPKGEAGATGAQGPQGPKGDPGAGGGLASFDGVNGLPCNQGTGTMQVSYNVTNGGASLTCQPSTFFTLTLKVSGGTTETIPPPVFTVGGVATTVYHPVTVTGTPSINCAARPDNTENTCIYTLPAGTAVSMHPSASIAQSTWSGPAAFTLTGDTTRTFAYGG
ncbi:MAG: hypothetical protein QOH16_2647 [Gaiellaceae bacterium]|nr:hypothetical protein [Gaiellaceae bacterium]